MSHETQQAGGAGPLPAATNAPRGPHPRSRHGVLYTVTADDVVCGFAPAGPSESGDPLLWEELLGRMEVSLG